MPTAHILVKGPWDYDKDLLGVLQDHIIWLSKYERKKNPICCLNTWDEKQQFVCCQIKSKVLVGCYTQNEIGDCCYLKIKQCQILNLIFVIELCKVLCRSKFNNFSVYLIARLNENWASCISSFCEDILLLSWTLVIEFKKKILNL